MDKIKKIIEEVWDCKKEGWNVDIFPDGTTYAYAGTNNNENCIKKYEKDKYKNTFPKTKKELTQEIIELFQ